jgi:very-short-patch-repair endonuclease
MVAVLVSGPGAVLSHRSAAALWGIGTEWRRMIDVTLRCRGEVRRPGIRARSRPSLPASNITSHLGIPVTTPIRTLIDLATELAPNRLERAVNEADKHDLVDPDVLRAALNDYAGERGVRPLRSLLDKHTFRLSDEELERRFRPIAAAAGLPVPETKQWVTGFEVDFFWPDLGLVVETDGWRYHRTPAAQTRDARRFQAHTAAGLTPLRFSHWQIKHEAAYVRRILIQTASHAKRRRPARSDRPAEEEPEVLQCRGRRVGGAGGPPNVLRRRSDPLRAPAAARSFEQRHRAAKRLVAEGPRCASEGDCRLPRLGGEGPTGCRRRT